MIDWLIKDYIELTGFVMGLIYVFLSIRQNKYLWIVGILSSAFYILVFWRVKIYANMSLQFYYLLMSVYGWYKWDEASQKEDPDKKIQHQVTFKTWLNSFLLGSFLFFPAYWLLGKYTDSPFPGWDAFTTVLSILATWMLIKKYIENWLIWIATDLISVILYLQLKLYPTVLLFTIYTAMAFIGYWEWKKFPRVLETGK